MWQYLWLHERPKFTFFCKSHRISESRCKDIVFQWLFLHLWCYTARNPPLACIQWAVNGLFVPTCPFLYFMTLLFPDLPRPLMSLALSTSTRGLSNRGWTIFDIVYCWLPWYWWYLGHSAHRSINVAALWPWLYKFRRHNYSALPKPQ